MDDVNLDELAKISENFNGADIAAVCAEAIMRRIRTQVSKGEISTEDVKTVKLGQEDFKNAIERIRKMHKRKSKVTPQITHEDKIQFL